MWIVTGESKMISTNQADWEWGQKWGEFIRKLDLEESDNDLLMSIRSGKNISV